MHDIDTMDDDKNELPALEMDKLIQEVQNRSTRHRKNHEAATTVQGLVTALAMDLEEEQQYQPKVGRCTGLPCCFWKFITLRFCCACAQTDMIEGLFVRSLECAQKANKHVDILTDASHQVVMGCLTTRSRI